ncbi:MAG: ABC transporter ATP-binding protein [Acetobacteraceae bacterium]|nr:ABC transporter ATP-binding protein [Acetobacteraceae bacterium]
MAIDALTLTDIDAYYGDSHVLHRVSLTLKQGELLALLGRNGAGKSTTLATVMGWLKPRPGRISVFGEQIGGLSPEAIVAKGVALVPQGRRIFPSLSVRENLIVAARGKGRWDMERVFDTFPRLRERKSQAAGSLSGGEQQMLAIGRALMSNPRVLMMDEPSEGLAPQIVAEVGRIIAGLREEGLSILLVEQNLDLAMSLANDVVILNTGRVAAFGNAADIARNQDVIDQNLGVF